MQTENRYTPIIIAVDGYSSCGKSTLARDLAKVLRFRYIDSGAMYRAVTLYAIRKGLINNDLFNIQALETVLPEIAIGFEVDEQSGLNRTLLNGEDVEDEIRQPHVSSWVSPVSAVVSVRRYLVSQQQLLGRNKGIVMDGRDIGTVVFPQAELKLFVTATLEVRTQRRYDELIAKGTTVSREEVMKNLSERDRMDSTRDDSPLRQADDAILLDNSQLDRQQQLAWALAQAQRAMHSLNE